MTNTTPARLWGAATAVIGAAMLARPTAVSRILPGTSGAAVPNTAVVRILGGRQLLQGAAVFALPAQPLVLAGSSAVDALHATSMVAAAKLWPRYRRPALLSAAIASTSAAVGGLISRRARR